jgi:hypothetical protein
LLSGVPVLAGAIWEDWVICGLCCNSFLGGNDMDGTTTAVDVTGLKAGVQEELDRCLEKIVASVNAAAPGRLLADTEEIARDALHDFAQLAYQKALQRKIDAAEAAFPPSGGSRDGKAL